MSVQIYQLSIKILELSPKIPIVGKPFTVTYHVKNRGQNTFPGGVVTVIVSWPRAHPIRDEHRIEINKELKPEDIFEDPHTERPLDEVTVFQCLIDPKNPNALQANDKGQIELYLADENEKLTTERVIHIAVGRTQADINEARSMMIAACSLVALLAFQLIDWIISTSLNRFLIVIGGILLVSIGYLAWGFIKSGSNKMEKKREEELTMVLVGLFLGFMLQLFYDTIRESEFYQIILTTSYWRLILAIMCVIVLAHLMRKLNK